MRSELEGQEGKAARGGLWEKFLGRDGHDMHDRPAGDARALCAGS